MGGLYPGTDTCTPCADAPTNFIPQPTVGSNAFHPFGLMLRIPQARPTFAENGEISAWISYDNLDADKNK